MKKLIIIAFAGFLLFACEDFVSINPPNSRVATEDVYQSEETAIAAMLGIYHQMVYSIGFAEGGYVSVALLTGLAADELSLKITNNVYAEFNQNSLTPINTNNYTLWSSCYQTIYITNAIIEGVSKSDALRAETRQRLDGEARFIRAFTYFYLVNLYGSIPLITSTDYRINALASRTPIPQVYEQIVSDLTIARNKLDEKYVSVSKARPNKLAATALLARVYLYLNDWVNAEAMASEVISSGVYDIPDNLSSVFLSNSSEVLWHLIPTNGTTAREGTLFILTGAPNFASPASLTVDLVSGFEPNDLRRESWIGSFSNTTETYYFSHKYKNKSIFPAPQFNEYSVMLRLAEQFLIRAETRAQQNNLSGAISDVNVIRDRAGLPLIQDDGQEMTLEHILEAIMQQRRYEFFAEWGHRWFDLKRTNRGTEVMQSIKPEWNSTDVLFPIPEQEILVAPNLKPQNPGY